MFTVHAISDQVSVLVDQAELTPKSSTGNIYLSAQNIGNEKNFRTHSPPAYQSSSNGSSRRGSIQGKSWRNLLQVAQIFKVYTPLFLEPCT